MNSVKRIPLAPVHNLQEVPFLSRAQPNWKVDRAGGSKAYNLGNILKQHRSESTVFQLLKKIVNMTWLLVGRK